MNAKSPTNESAAAIKIIAENRKARFTYHITEKFEAGIVLTGAEIKSIRANGISIAESYVRPQSEKIGRSETSVGVFLIGAHIAPYQFTADPDYVPTRPRRLLLNRREIDKLSAAVERKGLTIVPLTVYLKKGRAKLEIALARGKDAPDKRQAIKSREGKRELARSVKNQ